MLPSRRYGVLALSLVFSAAPLTRLAFAEPSDADRATARELGTSGLEALEKKDYPRARDLLTRADRLFRAPTLELGLARAQVASGKLVAARETYARLAREPVTATSPDAFKNAVELGKKELAAVEPRVPTLVLSVDGVKEPTLMIDGEAVPSFILGARRPVDPGKHKLDVTAPGYFPQHRDFAAKEGETVELRVTMVKDVAVAVPETPTVETGTSTTRATGAPGAPVSKSPPSKQPLFGYIALGIGGAALATSAVTGVLAIGKKSDLDDRCPNGACPPEAQSTHDSFLTLRTVSTIGFLAGVVGVGTGVTLLLTAPKRPNRTGVAPTLGPGYVGLSGKF